MSCEIFNIESPLFRVSYQSIDKSIKKKIYYFVGDIKRDIKTVLNKIEEQKTLTAAEKNKIKKEYPKDYAKMLSYSKLKDNVIFIDDLINLDNTVIDIKKKIFYYLSDTKNSTFLNINNQLLWLEDNIILGYNYNNDNKGKGIIPSLITKIKVDYSFMEKDGEKIKRDDIISNNDIMIYDILDKHDLLNNKNIKLTVINANNIITFLKSKKKLTDNLINGWLFKYFPKYNKIKINECDKIYKNIRNKVLKRKYINNIEIDKKFKDELIDYCSISTIKIKTNVEKIKKHYKTDDININLDNIFFYLVQKSKLFGKDIPFIKINNYNNERSVLIWKDIHKTHDKKKIKKWIGLDKDKDKVILKRNNILIQIKKYYKNIDYIDPETNEKKNIPLYFTISILTYGNIILNISYPKTYKININNIIEILDNVGTLINKLNNPSNVKLINNINNFKIIKPNIKYINNKFIKDDFTDIDYFNIIITYKTNIKNLYDFSKLLILFKENIKINNDIDKEVTNLKFKYIKVSKYLDIFEIILYIKQLVLNNYSEQQILKDIIKKFYLTHIYAKEIIKIWKKMYDKE